jgi:short-subunit dehydrogenase
MKNVYGNVVLITGASAGIGKVIAENLAKNGLRVYGTSRKPAADTGQADLISSINGGFLKMIQLDVCAEDSIKKAIDYVLKQEGRIDILINNAGFGMAGSVEDTSSEEAYLQLNTNFFGTHRMCRNILPIMRKQNKGLIINICSVNGFITLPFQSMYCASKYALEALTETLRMEVKPYGIRAVLIDPGDIHSEFTDRRYFTAASKDSVYKERFSKSIGKTIHEELNGSSPEIVIKDVAKVIGKKNPPVRIVVGFSYKLFAFLKRVLPSRLVEFIVSKMY